jgi:hypothetical protein
VYDSIPAWNGLVKSQPALGKKDNALRLLSHSALFSGENSETIENLVRPEAFKTRQRLVQLIEFLDRKPDELLD